jgi:hypothetical protein
MPSRAKLVTRALSTTTVTVDSIPKNASLTNAELDSNFLNLRDQSWAIRADDSTLTEVPAGTEVNFDGATVTANANGDITISNIGGGSTGEVEFFGRTMAKISSIQGVGDSANNLLTMTVSPYNNTGTARIFIQGLGELPNVTPVNGNNYNQFLRTNGQGVVSWANPNISLGSGNVADPGAGGSITPDFSSNKMLTCNFGSGNSGTVTINLPTGLSAGEFAVLIFTQKASTYTNILMPNYYWPYGTGAMGVGANTVMVFSIYYNGTDYIATNGASANLST